MLANCFANERRKHIAFLKYFSVRNSCCQFRIGVIDPTKQVDVFYAKRTNIILRTSRLDGDTLKNVCAEIIERFMPISEQVKVSLIEERIRIPPAFRIPPPHRKANRLPCWNGG